MDLDEIEGCQRAGVFANDDARALLARVRELEAALADAVDDIDNWAAYATDYFREKWDLEGDLRKYREILNRGAIA